MSTKGFIADAGLLIQPQELVGVNRMHLESKKLGAKFPQFEWIAAGDRLTAATGYLQTSYGNSYGLRIEIPSLYPIALPYVWPAGWSIRANTPHAYRDGQICIMRAEQWNDKFTIAFCVAKAALWLNKYDFYLRLGYWPGLGQSH
jgi:ubiquitin-protein ligase